MNLLEVVEGFFAGGGQQQQQHPREIRVILIKKRVCESEKITLCMLLRYCN